MGKEEEKGSRAADTDERPQKAPRLESTDSGCSIQRLSSSIVDEGREPCYHFLILGNQLDSIVAKIKSRHQAPKCEPCWLETFKRTASGSCKQQRLVMVCLECKHCYCAGFGVAITDPKPLGHAWSHAHLKGHWIALWFDQPHKAYCFSCETVLYSHLLYREKEVLESAVDDESDAHSSWPDTDQLCRVIRGIPNCGNTCYVNALVQCLLALDKMRTWMLGPNIPMGSLAGALKELFVQTTPGNDAEVNLNPNELLESLGALNAQYAGGTMEDSQELLLDMRSGLHEEEKLQLPPKMRGRFPAVVDSIFQGQMSNTLTCKWCLYSSSSDEQFCELSVTLPSKGQTTKSVDSPQRSLAIEESNSKKTQTDAMDKGKVSESLSTDCTKAEQVWQREDDLLGILQTQEDNISCSELLREVIEVPENSYLWSQHETTVEPKESTITVHVTPEDKGKDLSRNFIYGDKEDNNSLASIEHCLAYYFKEVEVELTCGNCKKIAKEAEAGYPVKGSASSSTTNEESDRDGKAEKKIYMSIVQDSQNASTPPNSRQQTDLDIADQVREDENEQEERKGKTANKAVVISKLPPVLTVHLKRFHRVDENQVKVAGHVSFGENLDVGQFVDPRSKDKDNSSYRLSGVIEHIGDYLNTGHNIAYMRASTIGSGSSLWFRASDGYIHQVSLEEVLKCEAYILFYERMEG
ncbi:hypothetical protein PR202_ga30947 [Eleusine coracana subsp. coracana]|uniref:USP domain-containing protein n=1 Tax=Eleusine coracana subsp. coracana TaxID=191504 RepID=A0AAV5DQP1_ELECO|nr:hypothetical protein QOZ80_8AG0614740 [Eleusine coracana subsp. coracana]GJN12652.1 hypothetical protein PR202_ga30947 [Eleusine coracana subsp. coracana]